VHIATPPIYAGSSKKQHLTGLYCKSMLGAVDMSVRYLEFAVQCNRLAKLAKTEEDRLVLKEMAEAWKKLAREPSRKKHSTAPE
jgi:hypothetical protein